MLFIYKKNYVSLILQSPKFRVILHYINRQTADKEFPLIGVNLKKFKVDDATAFLVNVQTTW